jgi:glucan endo-1,3-alpha-glucosidase
VRIKRGGDIFPKKDKMTGKDEQQKSPRCGDTFNLHQQRFSLSFLLLFLAMSNKIIIAHYMIPYTDLGNDVGSYMQEIRQAAAIGIDGFAVNCGDDFTIPFFRSNLANMFDAADRLMGSVKVANSDRPFQITISIDTDNFHGRDPIGDMVAFFNAYKQRPSYLKHPVNGNPIVTTFSGDRVDWSSFKARSGPCHLIVNASGYEHFDLIC